MLILGLAGTLFPTWPTRESTVDQRKVKTRMHSNWISSAFF
uniref:Uncharacterized protein n=1 Tax=Anguilla anguilla TaxID=7936 RepID=A0A0E9SYY0_ANGAN